jgi:hypothetical protein
MPWLICLLPVCGVLVAIGGAYFAVNLRRLISNRNALISAEKIRVRRTTARRLIEIKKRKNGQ